MHSPHTIQTFHASPPVADEGDALDEAGDDEAGDDEAGDEDSDEDSDEDPDEDSDEDSDEDPDEDSDEDSDEESDDESDESEDDSPESPLPPSGFSAPGPPPPSRKSVTYHPLPLSLKFVRLTFLRASSLPHSGQGGGASLRFMSFEKSPPQSVH
jgi:hypothetical protein